MLSVRLLVARGEVPVVTLVEEILEAEEPQETQEESGEESLENIKRHG
jgi:CheY-like chemotaxis protein